MATFLSSIATFSFWGEKSVCLKFSPEGGILGFLFVQLFKVVGSVLLGVGGRVDPRASTVLVYFLGKP